MVNISCSTKSHAFNLAEQLQRLGYLNQLFTVYHANKNSLVARFNKRKDYEKIAIEHLHTFPFLTPLFRLRKDAYRNNELFDRLVSRQLSKHSAYELFIGWSGMSLRSIKKAKAQKKKVILERGSSHISNQFDLLDAEYKMLGKTFKRDRRVEEKEKEEYELADYITVPSQFAKQSFIERGFSRGKLFVNNFGVSSYFSPSKPKNETFTILYVGSLTVQKGLIHLFRALQSLDWSDRSYQVWFVGNVSEEIKEQIPRYQKANWKFFGHINHYELSDIISSCSVMVQPSIQEGLSMVLPQVMSCGVPVIATTNTGGADIITDGVDGFIVPIRSPEAIAEKLTMLFSHPEQLTALQTNALNRSKVVGTWNDYGDRYGNFINAIVTNR